MSTELPDKNLFMMCKELNSSALSALPDGFHVRRCRRDELDIWKSMPFDEKDTAKEHADFMMEYFKQVYGEQEDLFFQKCLFVCDQKDTPVATCFAWKAYGEMTTIHWLKVLKDYEGLGIGRALLSRVMKDLPAEDYPVFLHTQSESFRAVKLYTDFGFALLTDPVIGNRKNDLEESLPILKELMPKEEFDKLQFTSAPKEFLEAVRQPGMDEF